MDTFSLTSPAFEHNGKIPAKYTCDGERTMNPPLVIKGEPKEAKSLALIMDDPDVPKEVKPDGVFDHWVLFNIPAGTTDVPEGAALGVSGVNGAGKEGYIGPCPPPQYEPAEHRYIFTLYALSSPLALAAGATKQEVLEALAPLTIAKAELIGRYSRK